MLGIYFSFLVDGSEFYLSSISFLFSELLAVWTIVFLRKYNSILVIGKWVTVSTSDDLFLIFFIGSCIHLLKKTYRILLQKSEIVKAEIIYVLLKKSCYISRSLRIQWFLQHLNTKIRVTSQREIVSRILLFDILFFPFFF